MRTRTPFILSYLIAFGLITILPAAGLTESDAQE